MPVLRRRFFDRNGLELLAPVTFQGLPGARDGIAFAVDEPLDLQRQLHFAAAVKALPGSTLVRLELGKLGLPKTQHIRFDGADPGHIPDLEVQAIWNGGRVGNALAGKMSSHCSPEESALLLAKALLFAQYRNRCRGR